MRLPAPIYGELLLWNMSHTAALGQRSQEATLTICQERRGGGSAVTVRGFLSFK